MVRRRLCESLPVADPAIFRLIVIQGPHGEWPCFSVGTGTVVDFYELYLVMAFLHHATMHNVLGAREALVRGIDVWVPRRSPDKIHALIEKRDIEIAPEPVADLPQGRHANWTVPLVSLTSAARSADRLSASGRPSSGDPVGMLV